MIRIRARRKSTAILALAIAVSVGTGISTSSATSDTSGSIDDLPRQSEENIPSDPADGAGEISDEYQFSVADVEAPSAVRKRAQKLLGSRYVELRIAEDQRSYIVSALDLGEAQREELAKELSGAAPVTLETATVARRDLEALRDEWLFTIEGVEPVGVSVPG